MLASFSYISRYLCTTILLLLIFQAFPQTNQRGVPFIRNYEPKEYQANEQNWAIAQDFRGHMYFGNQENGILEFDGESWRKITLPNNPSIRSLAVDSSGNIFVGAVREFGRLVPDEMGFLKYQSLTHHLDSLYMNFGDVWKTYASKDKVYFYTYSRIYVYDYKGISMIKPPVSPYFAFLINEDLYCGSSATGLNIYDPNTKKFVVANGGEFYKKINILSMLPYDASRIIIGSLSKGCFLYDKKLGLSDYLPVPSHSNPLLINNGLYHGSKILDNRYGYASMFQGISIIDHQGNLLYQINKKNGLQENITTYTYTNNNEIGSPLWIAMTKGISKMEVNSPINIFSEVTGINDITSFQDKLYIANDLGVFHLDFDDQGLPQFNQIENVSNAWLFLKPFTSSGEKEAELLVATSYGVYKIEENVAYSIHKADARIIYQSRLDANLFYIGTTDGIGQIERKNGKWGAYKKRNDFQYETHSIDEDQEGNIWVGTYLNGVIKIDKETAVNKKYGPDKGLPSLKSIRIARINNDMVFATEKGIYYYDNQQNRFFPYDQLEESFSDGSKGILKIFQDHSGRIWTVSFKGNKYWIDLLDNTFSDTYKLISKPFRRIPNMTYQSIYTDKNNITWIGGSEGLYSYDNSIKRSYDQTYHAYVRKVILGQDSVIFGGTFYEYGMDFSIIITKQQNPDNMPEIKYSENSLSLEFASPFFENEDALEFSWYLEGFDKDWNHWSSETKAFYTNLFEGSYTFKVKARNVYGTESEIGSYQFRILPPWYRTYIAYLAYLVIVLLLLRLIIKLYVRRLENEKIRLEGIVKERTAEIVKQKEKIEKAYENVKMLSKIGQDVTANLSVEKIVEIVYNNVNTLMEASIFAIGIVHEKREELDFLGMEEGMSELVKTSDPLDNEKLLSVWCFNKQKEIFINHFTQEDHPFEIYGSGPEFKQRESMIYLPLTTKEKKIGILTVQSFKTNVYSDYHLNILKNLAVYTSIALDNAEAYEKIDAQKTEIEKKNLTLQQQKEEIIAQRDEIEAQRDYVTQQRDQIAKQNKAITDSIQYAKRIQSAVLPPDDQFSKSLPDHFIFFKPRDIVSGDFYWMRQIDNYVVITAADCTGHGVPGAFMSMLGISFLNEIVRRKDITKAHHVLNELRKYIKTSLRQTGKEGEAKDGMDMALCVINLESLSLQYAGAYNPLYLFRNSELTEIKADKMPIGIHINEKCTFTNHQIPLEKGDIIYLFSDGFPDQFGGEKGQKFKAKHFKNLLHGIHEKPMVEQKVILDKTLRDWQGDHEQVDDITIIGIKI